MSLQKNPYQRIIQIYRSITIFFTDKRAHSKIDYYFNRTFTINIVGFKNNSTIFVVEL